MSTAEKLDMMPSKDISDYAEKVLLNNPLKISKLKTINMHNCIKALPPM